jgi:hypothetical protein
MEPLRATVYGFIGVLMFGVILDWIDRKAIRLKRGELMPLQWITWCKREAFDKQTGTNFEYYVLAIRLPSYAWDYRINNDDYGWMQNSLLWFSRHPSPGNTHTPHAGWNLWRISPLPSWNERTQKERK